jgi:micrococcal nuclease
MDNYIRRAKVTRVVDGDTVDLEVDLGYHISTSIRGRLLGIDTPERGQPDFALATDTLASLLEENTDEDGYVSIKSTKTGKFGRWLVEITGVNQVLEQKWPYEY